MVLSSAEEPRSATDAFWEHGVFFKTGEGDSAETAMYLIHTGHVEEEREGCTVDDKLPLQPRCNKLRLKSRTQAYQRWLEGEV